MPITEFQKKVLLILAENRNPESYVAGASVINKSEDSPRFSNDIDFFHDPARSVNESFLTDRKTLIDNNFEVELLVESRGFVRSLVRRGSNSLKLEWANDSAFRFFPAVKDKDFGYRLHEVDAAVNKCLALAGRTEARDVIDMLTINDKLLHIGYCCWAACGKDPGFTPQLLLQLLSRNARITPDLLALENILPEVDLKQIKKRWLVALEEAQQIVDKQKSENIGCIYLNKKGEVEKLAKTASVLHFGSVRGAWPKMDLSGINR